MSFQSKKGDFVNYQLAKYLRFNAELSNIPN